jgi:hypothetical protein
MVTQLDGIRRGKRAARLLVGSTRRNIGSQTKSFILNVTSIRLPSQKILRKAILFRSQFLLRMKINLILQILTE